MTVAVSVLTEGACIVIAEGIDIDDAALEKAKQQNVQLQTQNRLHILLKFQRNMTEQTIRHSDLRYSSLFLMMLMQVTLQTSQ